MDHEEVRKEIVYESLQLLNYLSALEEEMSKGDINRNKCKILWGRVKTSLNTIKNLLNANSLIKNSPSLSKVLYDYLYDNSLDSRVEELINNPIPDFIISEFNDPVRVISDIRLCLRRIWGFYGISDEFFPMIRMMRFVSKNPLKLNQNWAVAVVYLTALEIAVNTKRKEFGLRDTKEISENGERRVVHKTFEERFRELVKVTQGSDLNFKGIKRELPQAFWKVRNDVVHGGHIPDDEELKFIIEWVERIVNSLFPSK